MRNVQLLAMIDKNIKLLAALFNMRHVNMAIGHVNCYMTLLYDTPMNVNALTCIELRASIADPSTTSITATPLILGILFSAATLK